MVTKKSAVRGAGRQDPGAPAPPRPPRPRQGRGDRPQCRTSPRPGRDSQDARRDPAGGRDPCPGPALPLPPAPTAEAAIEASIGPATVPRSPRSGLRPRRRPGGRPLPRPRPPTPAAGRPSPGLPRPRPSGPGDAASRSALLAGLGAPSRLPSQAEHPHGTPRPGAPTPLLRPAFPAPGASASPASAGPGTSAHAGRGLSRSCRPFSVCHRPAGTRFRNKFCPFFSQDSASSHWGLGT